MKLIAVYGRMNPVHRGHEILLRETKKRASNEGSKFRVFLTRTQDQEKNPLSFKDKERFVSLITGYGVVRNHKKSSNLFKLLEELSEYHSEIELVLGGDRFSELAPLIEKYQSDFRCPVKVSCFAERDRYNWNATEMRRLAREGRYQEFMDYCPEVFTPTQKIQLFSLVSVGMTKLNNEPTERRYRKD